MQIDLTAKALLSQLGYSTTENSIKQIEVAIKNTKGFELCHNNNYIPKTYLQDNS